MNTKKSITEDIIDDEEFFWKILDFLQDKWRTNYQHYRESFLKRRLRTIMSKIKCSSFKKYFLLLKEKDGENCFDAFKLFRVNVSQFFRNYDIFQALRDDILSEILQQKSDGEELRVWSAGCASGEEPYSFAILFDDFLEQKNIQLNFSVLGTDIDKQALKTARDGFYQFKRVKGCPTQFFRRYFKFNKSKGKYKIVNYIKKKVKFLKHDLLSSKDVPGKFNLIFCRNVFIYLKEEPQKNLLQKFHEKLNKNGFLILGKAESIPREFSSLFRVVHSWEHIYMRV